MVRGGEGDIRGQMVMENINIKFEKKGSNGKFYVMYI